MPFRARPLLAVALGLAAPASAAGQGTWVPHQPPCKLSTGHYLINGSMMHLKLGVESRFADQRGGRLREARSVLYQAILEKGQGENPAAWYYLGRAYAELQDLLGADSAFRRALALAPDCADDIAGHAARLGALALNDALRAWGAGERDSALVALQLAASLDPRDAEIPLYASIMYAGAEQPDSAARYLEIGRERARTDTAHGQRLRQATLDVARAFETRAYQHTPASGLAQLRAQRDSTARQLGRDSTLFAKILTEVGGIRAQGQRLNPQALAAFQRDSTTLATRIATGRHALDSLRVQAEADSAAAAPALGPTILAYRAYLEAYPDDADKAVPLLRLLAATGDRAAINEAADRLAASPHATNPTLVEAALGLHRDALFPPAARLVEQALNRNPNDHGALAVATYVYHADGRAAPLKEVARRRLTLAPLDAAAAQAMALAWNLAGEGDSTLRYLALADTGLGWNVHVAQFNAGEHLTSLNGYVVNASRGPLPATDLIFDFLDAAGAVRFTTTVPVPALEPRGRAPIAVRREEGGAASWRYHRP